MLPGNEAMKLGNAISLTCREESQPEPAAEVAVRRGEVAAGRTTVLRVAAPSAAPHQPVRAG